MAKIFIANIPYSATEADIVAFFAAENIPASKVKICTDRETGASKGFGFAEVPDADEQQAIRMSGFVLLNRKVKIDRARTPQGGRR